MSKEQLLLSTDGDISLYKVDKEIIENFDNLLKDFFLWKRTNCYDETLFVKFLKRKLGEKSIEYIRVVGCCKGKINQKTGLIEDDIEEEFKNAKWFNF